MDIHFFEKAERLVELGKWKYLRKICLEQLEIQPTDPNATYFVALSYLEEGNLEKAGAIIRSLLSDNSENIHYKSFYVRILIQEKRFIDAEQLIIAVLNISPTNDFYLSQYAEIKLRLLQFKDASELASKSLAINPSNEMALNILVLSKEFNDDTSSYDLKSFSGINPKNPFTLAKNIEALLEGNKIVDACDLALNSLALHPNDEYLKSIAEEVISAKSPVLNFIRKLNQKIKSVILNNNKWLVVVIFSVIICLNLSSILFNSSLIVKNLIGYSIVVCIFSFSFLNPIKKIFVSIDETGKKLYDKNDIVLLWSLKLSLILASIFLFLGCIISNRLSLLVSLGILSCSIPISYVIESRSKKSKIRKTLVWVFMINLLFMVISYLIHSIDFFVICIAINCMFSIIYISIETLLIIQDKYG